MQKILYIRIRIFLPPKLKILIYAYKKKKGLDDTGIVYSVSPRAAARVCCFTGPLHFHLV